MALVAGPGRAEMAADRARAEVPAVRVAVAEVPTAAEVRVAEGGAAVAQEV